MKSVFFSRFCLVLLLCAALCLPAAPVSASALPDYNTVESSGAVYGYPAMALTNFCSLLSAEDQETLIIPGSVPFGETKLPVLRINADAFDDCGSLKYVRLDHSRKELLYATESAFDFTSAENLEIVFTNADVTGEVQEKFSLPAGAELQQYVDLSGHTLSLTGEFHDGAVTLQWDNCNHLGMYRVTRVNASSEVTKEVFDSEEYPHYFSIKNGIVTFTDPSVESGQTCRYTAEAYEPFGSSCSDSVMLVIPGTGAGIPDQGEIRLPATADKANPIVTGASFVLAFGMAYLLTRKKRRK